MKRETRHILLAVLLASFWCVQGARAESFGNFLVSFLSQPDSQGSKAHSSLTINGKRANKKGNYINLANKSAISILCADSIDTPIPSKSDMHIFILNFPNKGADSYTFMQNGKGFLLKEGHMVKDNVDYDFMSFLSEYSHNHDFQMKRTIFPLPQRYFKDGKEGDSKLQMPREWEYLDFQTISPQICVFKNIGEANNRRLYTYKDGKLSKIYNFISISRKWFLIEVENY